MFAGEDHMSAKDDTNSQSRNAVSTQSDAYHDPLNVESNGGHPYGSFEPTLSYGGDPSPPSPSSISGKAQLREDSRVKNSQQTTSPTQKSWATELSNLNSSRHVLAMVDDPDVDEGHGQESLQIGEVPKSEQLFQPVSKPHGWAPPEVELKSLKEARLLHHFVANLGPWVSP